MRNFLLLLVIFFSLNAVLAQRVCNEFFYQKHSSKALNEDLNFIRDKIINVHINPFTGISRKQFYKNINTIRESLNDSLTQKDFYLLVKSIFTRLNDEHAGLSDYCITEEQKNNFKVFPLRFKYNNKKAILAEDYSQENLAIGDELTSINNISINQILDKCLGYNGASDEQKRKVIEYLWVYLPKFCIFITDDFHLTFKSGKDVMIKSLTWETFGKRTKDMSNNKNVGLISYKTYKTNGYLTVNSFYVGEGFTIEKWHYTIDSLFQLIQKDRVEKLFIDVSNNGGGNSEVGDILINYFSQKKYKTYSGYWRKSKEYSDFMKRLNVVDTAYEKLMNGELLLMKSEIIRPSTNSHRFNGETYIVIGQNTFSSAMQFAVTVQDNRLAKLIGEVPEKGHPNHFGEVISFKTPNTQLNFTFGVKEWIRPSGIKRNNQLLPDIPIDLKNKTTLEIIACVNQIETIS